MKVQKKDTLDPCTSKAKKGFYKISKEEREVVNEAYWFLESNDRRRN